MRDAMNANRGSLWTTSNLVGKTQHNQEMIRRVLDAREFHVGLVGRQIEPPLGYLRNQFPTSLSHPHTHDR